MIKIVFVVNYIESNGPGNVILDIINNLDKNEYSVSLITLFKGNDTNIVNKLKNHNVTVYSCSSLDRLKCLLGQDKEFKDIIMHGQFDIIHSHGFIPDILSSKLKIKVSRITTLHNIMFEDYLQTYGKLKSKIFIHMHLRAIKKLDLCICCSKSVFDAMNKYLKNINYVRNGIKPKSAKHKLSRESIGISKDDRVFIFSGGLTEGKNILVLISNFVKYHNRNEYLLILGDGILRNKCEQLADDHVKVLGFQNDPAAYYNISDIYISASKSEGFSISVLEALSCGLGLLLSNIPSHKEVLTITDKEYLGETFSIINEEFESSFKLALQNIRNHHFRKQNIKDIQLSLLSDKGMTREYSDYYKELLANEY